MFFWNPFAFSMIQWMLAIWSLVPLPFLFKKNLFIYFNWRLIIIQYCSGFCHTLTWISHGCTCVPHPEPPAYLPPHPIPLSHPSAPALSTLSHASNWDWQSVSHMIIYMFQCYSLKSSHHPSAFSKLSLYIWRSWFTHCWSLAWSLSITLTSMGASLVAQLVKNLPAMQETWVWFLGQKDLLEKG